MHDSFLKSTRRDVLRGGAAAVIGLNLSGLLPQAKSRASQSAGDSSLAPRSRFPRMVHEHFVALVREVEREADADRAALKTKSDAEAYVTDVRQKIKQSFGLDDPPEKTPLKPRVTGVVERGAYRIEKLIFESRPGFLVTANLYVPKGRKSPMPAVVGTCGHSSNGKAAEPYQGFAQGLARQGYVVLIYDPIGQGERFQYVGDDLKSTVGAGVREHLLAGNQQFLVGDFLGTWRAWDGIRALDYLLTRDEVDPQHVGVTGNSGGGTMTTWLCGVEDRWTMAAPSCFVTQFRRNLENELPADTEQCPPQALALGLDHSDFLAAMAPKPVIILAKEKDYFDARGAEEAYRRLKRLYALLGAEDNIGLFIGPSYHGYSQENREAMYHWFNKATGVSDAKSEPELTIEKDETLWCTPKGQVAELQSRTVMSFTRDKAASLAGKRKPIKDEALPALVRDALGIAEALFLRIDAGGAPQPTLIQDGEVPRYRIIRPHGPSRKYPKPYACTYAVETERLVAPNAANDGRRGPTLSSIHAVVYRLADERLMSRPPQSGPRAVLYVSHHSADVELREEPLISEVMKAEPKAAFFTCDVRGVGESRPGTAGDSFLEPYGSDYFYAIHSLMLDRPYVGQKTYDVLRVLDWLESLGHTDVHLVARGWGAIPATFAAVLSNQVKQITLKHALTSYADVAKAETYTWPLSSFVPNVLKSFDLPDCYEALEKKNLRQIEPTGADAETS